MRVFEARSGAQAPSGPVFRANNRRPFVSFALSFMLAALSHVHIKICSEFAVHHCCPNILQSRPALRQAAMNCESEEES